MSKARPSTGTSRVWALLSWQREGSEGPNRLPITEPSEPIGSTTIIAADVQAKLVQLPWWLSHHDRSTTGFPFLDIQVLNQNRAKLN